jgi:hypothetical protein
LGGLSLRADADAHIVLVPTDGAVMHGTRLPGARRGDFGYRAGAALAAEATASESGDGSPAGQLYTFGCIAVYRPAFFAGCIDGAFPLKPLLLRCMAARRCSAEIYAGLWEDVGTPERLAALNA